MKFRKLLQKAVIGMVLTGTIAFCITLLYSYGPSYSAVKSVYYFDLSDIQPRDVKRFRLPRSYVPLVVIKT